MEVVDIEGSRKRKLSSSDDANGSEPKKCEKETAITETTEETCFQDLSGFEVKRVLGNNAEQKRVTIEATYLDKTAVIVLDKKPFVEDTLGNLLSNKSHLQKILVNDVYGSYDCSLPVEASTVRTTIIYPASQKHIDKFIHHSLRLVEESPDIYKDVTLPYLQQGSLNLQWVYNILEHKQESERIVYEDPDPEKGFVLIPDLKWDGYTLENLYLVAITHKKGIKSIRELNENYLDLLENILTSGCKAIEEKYGVKRSQLRIYFHYQPSYYHLHVHFNVLRFGAPGIWTEKAHILQSVISNIKTDSEYYKKVILPFVVKENDKLYSKLVEYGYNF